MRGRKYLFVIALVVTMIAGNMQSCFAETALIPGYYGSGMAVFADISSAVFQPSKYTDVTCIGVCTKRVYRNGEEEDTGIWFFAFYEQTGHIKIRTNKTNGFVVYNDFRKHDREKVNFWYELRAAAEAND